MILHRLGLVAGRREAEFFFDRSLASNTKHANARSIRNCLRQANAAASAIDIGTDAEKLTNVLLRADEIRSRVTCLDLAHLTGVLPDQADDIIRTTVG